MLQNSLDAALAALMDLPGWALFLVALLVFVFAVKAFLPVLYSWRPGERNVYRCTITQKLYLYEENWNYCGHRSARQDWWAEIRFRPNGKFTRADSWFKHNVGYHPKPGQAWCHPYALVSPAELRMLRLTATESRTRRALLKLHGWLGSKLVATSTNTAT